MAEVFRYEVIPSASWAYLSTILMVTIFFKFNRLVSVRNLDILMLALLAPGLLIVRHGEQDRQKLEPEMRVLVREIQWLQELEQEQSSSIGTLPIETASGQPFPSSTVNPSRGTLASFTATATLDRQQTNPPPERSSVAQSIEKAREQLDRKSSVLAGIKAFQRTGYVWLFIASGCLLIRMLVDPFMIRRPLLEPNLEFSGLTFLTIVLLVFLIGNIVMASVAQEDITAAESGKNLATAKATDPTRSKGPGYSLLFLFPVVPTFVTEEVGVPRPSNQGPMATPAQPTGTPEPTNQGSGEISSGEKKAGDQEAGDQPTVLIGSGVVNPNTADGSLIVVAKIMAIIGQLSIVIGIYLVGYLHFNNTRMGIGIVTLYLLLPYTAEMTGRIIHILPAAAMVWAVACYRRPFWSGTFIGLAMGLAYYPIFLLPLWFSFYWHHGLKQFVIGFLVMVGILAVTLVFTSSDLEHFWQNLRAMFGIWAPLMEGLRGFWEAGVTDPSFRIPIIAAFFCLSISFAVWPTQKDLGTLLSCSAALMLAVQFWNGFGGGILMAWYLPLALMTIFRPNLEDRTATALALET